MKPRHVTIIEPIKAAVRPRVDAGLARGTVLLEDLVSELISSPDSEAIALFAKPASGVTTALQHIAFHFNANPQLIITELNRPAEEFLRLPIALIVYRRSQTLKNPVCLKCTLAGWERDEWIEYLLAVHKPRCASVMKRILADPDVSGLYGNPNLIRQVLDEMAEDEQQLDVKSSLDRILEKRFANTEQRLATGRRIVLRLFQRDEKKSQAADKILSSDLSHDQLRLLYNRWILVLLAVQAAWHDLQHNFGTEYLPKEWTRELIKAVAAKVAESPQVQHLLERTLVAGNRDDQPCAVSLLNLAGVPLIWPPAGVSGFPVKPLNLRGAILDDADCSRFRLAGSCANRAMFARARLNGANLKDFNGESADFSSANLAFTTGEFADFRFANFSHASLKEAQLDHSDFDAADLIDADFQRANLVWSTFRRCELTGATFQAANLDRTNFSNCDMTVADFRGATFRFARLYGCLMDEIELPNADFESANLEEAQLTGSVLPRANLSKTNLRDAKLANVQWESVDLRYADLAGATFHMGSSRSGLVPSSIPMEGSKTGFYTDEWNEQDYKAPEEIRTANLRGADLRGAMIDGVDFYLVDLRDALYDPDQLKQLRRTGAILETRIC